LPAAHLNADLDSPDIYMPEQAKPIDANVLQASRKAGHQQCKPVSRHRRSMFGRRVFSVAGPAAWNSLPDYLRDPSRTVDSFRRDLKTFLSSFYQRTQRIRGFAIVRYINLLLTVTYACS